MDMRACENCGRTIGNLETSCEHGGHTVCQQCHGSLNESRLEGASGSPRTSGMAIASLVLSLVGLPIFGLIFGVIALSKIKSSGGMLLGRGMALAGTIISSVFIAAGAVIAAVMILLLPAVAVPVMHGRIDAAKWSEGKAIGGAVATAIRAYAAEYGAEGPYGENLPTLEQLGFIHSDLQGTYFNAGNYEWTTSYDSGADPAIRFTIMITHPTLNPSQVTLDHAGNWTEAPSSPAIE